MSLTTEETELLKKIPQENMVVLLDEYQEYLSKYKYLRYVIAGIFVVIIGYNVFVAGKSFPLEKLQTIQYGLAFIMCIFIVALIVLGVVLFKSLRKLKRAVDENAHKFGLNKKFLRKAFHKLLKTSIGGPGLR